MHTTTHRLSLRATVLRTASAITLATGLSAAPLLAQSLDIGGIELHLGQPISEALASLGSYRVVYSDAARLWSVGQRVGQDYQWFGTISARDGKVSFISKDFDLSTASDVARTYTDALRVARQRSAASCAAEDPVEASNGVVLSVDVWCGQYRVSYMLPSRFNDAPTGGGISVSVSLPAQ